MKRTKKRFQRISKGRIMKIIPREDSFLIISELQKETHE